MPIYINVKAYTTIILFVVSISLFAQQKRALIVGISDYPITSGWSKINSDNDIDILKQGVRNVGFSLTTLENQNATKEGIVQALDKLKEVSCKDDTVLIHFSCHGQQFLTEEKELLEALIPFDALKYYTKDYWGENHLLDFELGAIINQIREKIGADGLLFVTIDACHSGDAVRGGREDAPIRGTNSVFTNDPFYTAPNRKDIKKNKLIDKLDDESSFCAVYACQPYQNNYELKVGDVYYGSLSFAFYSALKKLATFNPTLLAKEIVGAMDKTVRKQNPYFESTFIF